MNIVQIFPGKVWGGAEQYVLDLGRALEKQGHKVTYMCLDAQAVTDRLDSEDMDYTMISRGSLSDRSISSSALRKHIGSADVIHIHDSAFVSPVTKANRNSGGHARIVFTRHIARGSRVMPWNRSGYLHLHAIIFVSDIARNMWLEANRWMPEDKCHVVHNSIPPMPVNLSKCDKTHDLRRLYDIDRQTPIMMFTGRVRRSKGCATIIEALAMTDTTRKWAMVFVGAGKPADYPETLMKMARKHGIADRIHFYGFTSDARSLVRQADIGLQPSIVREALGLSQLEFMQAGVPLITTDNGAQPEYVDNGRTGLLIPPDSPSELAHAIARLLCSDDLRADIGSTAALYFDAHLAYPIFIKRITDIYSSLS